MKQQNRDDVIRSLRQQGLTLAEICTRLGVAKSAVNRALYPTVRAYEEEYASRRYYTRTCEECGKPCTFNPQANNVVGRWCADCYHSRGLRAS